MSIYYPQNDTNVKQKNITCIETKIVKNKVSTTKSITGLLDYTDYTCALDKMVTEHHDITDECGHTCTNQTSDHTSHHVVRNTPD